MQAYFFRGKYQGIFFKFGNFLKIREFRQNSAKIVKNLNFAFLEKGVLELCLSTTNKTKQIRSVCFFCFTTTDKLKFID